MKKLFAMLLVGALVSMGCSKETNKGSGSKTEKTTEVKGVGEPTHTATSASRMTPEMKPDTKASGSTKATIKETKTTEKK